MLAPALAASCPVPFVHTVHRPLDAAYGEIYRMIARLSPDVGLISLSEYQRAEAPELPWIGNCANALDLDAYPSRPLRREDFLIFVGRLAADRGAAEAIDVAEALAGSIDREDPSYFEERVEPRLSKTIQYVGEVTHIEKIDLLRRARCSLFPLTFPEPFGFLMLESLACGTPVVALRAGAVADVVVDGEVGFICEDVADMPAAVEACSAIDREACRAYVVDRFSEVRMAREYLSIYRRFMARTPTPA
jgi:glycosyltransferase involved in cell wall biosynthesis